MSPLLDRLREVFAPRPRIDDASWRRMLRRVAVVRRLPAERQRDLRELCERFLREKAISGAADFEVREERALILAALCCLPVLSLGWEWMRGWDELIIYPGQFRVRRHVHDEATGVVEEFDDDLAGEAWDRGPLVLSWQDVREDLADPQAGCNVAVHEIAHKLDALDGAMDGTPPLPAAQRGAWVAAFQQAYDDLLAAVDAEAETAIDPYAATGPDEFFAVVSEYHFSAPDLLREAYPAVAAQLEQFYGPSPWGDTPR